MKPAPFEYRRPATLDEALRALGANPEAKVMAGGQTLGPMLNLRLAQPAEIVDITRIADLAQVSEETEAVVLGATVTHAAIEDGRTPDLAGGFLRRVAAGIGYRAVRTRGTIGGSLVHADPAADWLSALSALGAEVVIAGPRGDRRVAVQRFVRGALETELGSGEIVCAIRIPKYAEQARFGYHKICRKQGEFADAIGVAVHDPGRGLFRLVVSTLAGAPLVIERSKRPEPEELAPLLSDAGLTGDDYEKRLRVVALRRALEQALPA